MSKNVSMKINVLNPTDQMVLCVLVSVEWFFNKYFP